MNFENEELNLEFLHPNTVKEKNSEVDNSHNQNDTNKTGIYTPTRRKKT